MTLELNDPSPSRIGRSKKTVPSVVDPFADGGEMGAVMRSVDWSRTPIGAVETWSDSLRMMVRFLLANRFPLLLWWGPEYVQLYNEAYHPVLGSKHPHSIGQAARECWPEIWNVIGPLIDAPFHGGPSTWMEDIELEVDRHGHTEESHFTIAYNPVPDDTAPRGIGGVLATAHEITQRVVTERRMALLRDLGPRSVTGAQTAHAACIVVADILSRHSRDVPFALLYLLDEGAEQAHLAGCAGIEPGTTLSARGIDLSETSSAHAMSAVRRAIANGSMEVVDDLAGRFGPLPPGPWKVPPRMALVLPIPSTIARHPAGVLVAGVSALLALDDQHRAFLELLTTQIASAIGNARAYEEEQRRAEALAELDRAKMAFFSNVSHEFGAPDATAGARILLADDNADSREYAARLLRRRGWDVEVVSDGMAALAAIQRRAPDLVLSDVMMPGKDGFELLRALRSSASTSTIPVILLSARAGEEATIEGLDAGADDYLVKPFSARELLARVSAHLTLAQSRSRAVAEAEAAREDLTRANEQLQRQAVELLSKNDRLQEQSVELEAQRAALEESSDELRLESDARERAVREITAAEARYRALVDASAQIVWVRGPDASIVSEQPAWSSYTGQSFDAYAGWEWIEAVHPDDRGRLRTAWHVAIASRAPCNIDYRLRRHDGEFEWFEMRALPVFDAHGDVREYVGAETNITKRRNAEEVRQQFVALVENSADLVAIAELDGSLLYLNAAGRHLLGLTDASPVGAMQIADFSAAGSKDTLLEVAMPAALREGVWRGEIDLCHVRTAAPIPVDQVIFPIFDPESGAPIRFATVARDIRERKRNDAERELLLQRERSARAEAEEARTAAQTANRSKSAFLAAMSHELRTPLNAIAGHAQLLELGVHGDLTDAQRDALARIQRSEQHLLALINDVLNFAKLEAGRVEYRIQDVSLTDSVAEVVAMVEPQLGAKGIGVDVDVARDLVVRADRDKVEQVLLNLLSNAVKFTGTGGRVRIDAPRRAASGAGRDGDGAGHDTLADVIFLRVTDTGVGVPREKQSVIFEPFIQLQRNLKRPTEGTGLGLAISRDLAHGMGGDLRVRSTVGRGARFTLTLCRAGETPNGPQEG